MRILVFPVSGGAFPVQLGMVSDLYDLDIKPTIVLGSSGGNISGYISLSANWKTEDLRVKAKQLNSEIFLASWSPRILGFVPSWVFGYLKGSVYANGEGSDKIFASNFNKDSIKTTEMWTGTLNRTTGKGQLFCNKNANDAILKPRDDGSLASMWIRDCMEPIYMNGDVELISKVTMASASIPIIVPEKEINGQQYVDGGTLFSSPLTALSDRLLELNETIYHIDYISSFDIQTNDGNQSYRTLYDNSTLTFSELVKSLCIQDRLTAMEFIKVGQQITFMTMDGCLDHLKVIEYIRTCVTRSVLELYPVKNQSLNISGFTGDDVINMLDLCKKNYKIRFWCVNSISSLTITDIIKTYCKIHDLKYEDLMSKIKLTTMKVSSTYQT